ncbi:MAG: OmpA family protein [Alphaproteobacteria bacterium]|nr:OmpA family protein [Alphaproteobacteria bacterium]
MRHPPRLGIAVSVAVMGALILPAIACAQDCQLLLDRFNRAIDSGGESEAQKLVDTISTSADCGRYQVPTQRRLSALRLNLAQLLMARGRPVSDFERLLTAAQTPEVLWQASATLAEVRFGERRFSEAAQAYDLAIEIIKNETMTPTAPTKFDIDGLLERAGQARLLAANSDRFVSTAKDRRDGTLGGFYSASVRGIVPQAIPVPITFEYRKTDFTDVGQQAARELLEVLQEQKPSRILLVGHTDARGTAEFNMKLSRERAEAVAAFLRQKGLSIPVETDGKGFNEPAHLSDTSGLSQEDIYALNRRVEWRRE